MRKRNGLLESLAAGVLALVPTLGCVQEYPPETLLSRENSSAIEISQTPSPQENTSETAEPEFYWAMNDLTSNSPADITIVTTSIIPRSLELQDAIINYQETVFQINGFTTNYVELDSPECKTKFGVNALEMGEERTLDRIIETTGSKYIILLGDERTILRPERTFDLGRRGISPVPSDSWYCDANKDSIIDEGRSIGRIDDYTGSAEAIITGLQTATKLHKSNGLEIQNKVNAGTPRANYGICCGCTEQDKFINDISQTDLLSFAGHGDPSGFAQGYGEYETRNILFAGDIKLLNLQNHNPLVLAFGPCYAGANFDRPDLDQILRRSSIEFIRAGATGFIGNTVAEGYSIKFKDLFDASLRNGSALGDALSNAARQTSLENPDFIVTTHQYQLYGDPSVRVIDHTRNP